MTRTTTVEVSLDEPEAVAQPTLLIERVEARDDDALPELRELLLDVELWRRAARLAAAVKATWTRHPAADGFESGDKPGTGTP